MPSHAPRRLLDIASAVTASLLVALVSSLAIGSLAAAQDGPSPTVGEIVVDSYDCDTGRLSFHVPVTDVPHIPDSNGPLGASVLGHYEQGESGFPGIGFNPEPEDAPYTGDVPLSLDVPLTGEESMSPERASGSLVSIDISVTVAAGDGQSSPSDRSTASYDVTCGDAGTGEDAGGLEAGTTGDEESDDAEGTTAVAPASRWLMPVLSGIALLFGLAALRLRERA